MADVIVPILQFTSILPTLVVIMGVFSLVLIYFSLRTIVRPLQRLSEQAAQITGGDVSGLQQDVGGVEEIRQLHIALRDMAERIRHYQASMRDYIDGITQGQEAERARLSRDLHDETVQSFGGHWAEGAIGAARAGAWRGHRGDRGSARDARPCASRRWTSCDARSAPCALFIWRTWALSRR